MCVRGCVLKQSNMVKLCIRKRKKVSSHQSKNQSNPIYQCTIIVYTQFQNHPYQITGPDKLPTYVETGLTKKFAPKRSVLYFPPFRLDEHKKHFIAVNETALTLSCNLQTLLPRLILRKLNFGTVFASIALGIFCGTAT